MTETMTTGGAATLRLRPYRGPVDHPEMNRVANAVRAFNGDQNIGSVADMDNHYAHLEHADLPRDCALVELDGRVVGVRSRLAPGDDHRRAPRRVHPQHRAERAGAGVEELLVRHALVRSEQIIAEFGSDKAIAVQVFVTGRDDAQRAVVRGRGILCGSGPACSSSGRTSRTSRTFPLPDGFEIRRIDAGDRAMHRRVWDAAAPRLREQLRRAGAKPTTSTSVGSPATSSTRPSGGSRFTATTSPPRS